VTASLTFPILDELAFEQAIGSWQAVHDLTAQCFTDACTQMHANLNTWHGDARVRFMKWWWGGDGRTESDKGAKGDFLILLQMIDDIIGSLVSFRLSVASINDWLTQANTVIAANTHGDGMFTLHSRYGNPPANFYVEGGTMHGQGLTGLPYDCYIQIEVSPHPFPYTDDPYGGYDTPKWFLEANGYAGKAVAEFNTACQGTINRLSDLRGLISQVHWLKPYQHEAQGSYNPTDPGGYLQDPVWTLISDDPGDRPYDFKPNHVLGKVTWKNGQPTLASGGDPFDPPNVPSWYFGPDLLDRVVDVIKKYGLDALTVLLVGVGLGEAGAIIDTFLDSSEFYGALLEAASGGSIAGLVLDGFNLAVDEGDVDSVAKVIMEQMLGKNHEMLEEFGNQLQSEIEKRILASPKHGRQYTLNMASLTTPSSEANTAAFNSGYDPIHDS
jgi:hypothetical protein